MRTWLVALVPLLVAAPLRASAEDCVTGPDEPLLRPPVERIAPTLLVGWTFDRSASSFIGLEVSYTHQHRATFGGYASAWLLSDPDAAGRRAQVAIGGIAAPWSAPALDGCAETPWVDPRPLARLGWAWRASNLEADATSFAQAGLSASAVLGVVLAWALPLSGGRSHGSQPSVAFTLSVPWVVGRS